MYKYTLTKLMKDIPINVSLKTTCTSSKWKQNTGYTCFISRVDN